VEEKTVTLESGFTLKQIINEASKNGLVLPHTPYWYGLTIGGMMETGSHGSTLWGKGSSIHDYVVEIRIVRPLDFEDGYAKVEILNEQNNEDFNAAKVSLGVLGVISQVWSLICLAKFSQVQSLHDLYLSTINRKYNFYNQFFFGEDKFWYSILFLILN